MSENDQLAIAFSTRGGYSAAELADYAARAEARGFRAVFVSERSTDALALTQVLAEATTTIGVGTAITNVHLRHPASAALTVAAVDEAARGRLILGIGTGDPGYNRTVLDAAPKPAIPMVREWVEILRAALEGGPVDHQGSVYRTHGLSTYRQPFRASVPLFIGAILPRMLALAGAIGDGVMYGLHSPAWVERSTAIVRDAAEQAGRDPAEVTISCLIPCCVSDDADDAARSARQVVAGYSRHPSAGRLFDAMGFAEDLAEVARHMEAGDVLAAAEAVPQVLADEFIVHGDVVACRSQLDEYRRAGVGLPIAFPMALGDGGWQRAALNALQIADAD